MKGTGLALMGLMLLTPLANAQQDGANGGAPPAPPKAQKNNTGTSGRTLPSDPFGTPTAADSDNPQEPGMEGARARMVATERQKKLLEDSGKLVDLANQLKTEVDKSSKDTMSIQVIKKADEIEKLAHSVKERMKS